jgi:integrase
MARADSRRPIRAALPRSRGERPLQYSNGLKRSWWATAVRKAGMHGLGFHDLRRTNATAVVRDNVDAKTADPARAQRPPPHARHLRASNARRDQDATDGERFTTAGCESPAAAGR